MRQNVELCLIAGLWAVVHTGGLVLPGVIEKQTSSMWESMLRHNLVAPLRTARVFLPLLRIKRGWLKTFVEKTPPMKKTRFATF